MLQGLGPSRDGDGEWIDHREEGWGSGEVQDIPPLPVPSTTIPWAWVRMTYSRDRTSRTSGTRSGCSRPPSWSTSQGENQK